ncbi:hypothetical protein chiPu_0013356 [Chiloscyllium punctatum]|uniref:Uncharacterized protein n=1 Tax=Chiloscyllium punctatum TaxID=137246 RepID=A0A401SWU9_CHIPU|nr:hypothetical protein [Chiloscyllium punctatum]
MVVPKSTLKKFDIIRDVGQAVIRICLVMAINIFISTKTRHLDRLQKEEICLSLIAAHYSVTIIPVNNRTNVPETTLYLEFDCSLFLALR